MTRPAAGSQLGCLCAFQFEDFDSLPMSGLFPLPLLIRHPVAFLASSSAIVAIPSTFVTLPNTSGLLSSFAVL